MVDRVVDVSPETELVELLEAMRDEPIVLVHHGVRYRVSRIDSDPFANYDPEFARESLERAFGGLKGLDLPAFLEELRLERGRNSSGRLES